VHLKDYADGGFLPLGEGGLDFGRIMGALDDVGYDGWITVELDAHDDPKEGARISKKFLDEMTA
jgi:inosose dehydratase